MWFFGLFLHFFGYPAVKKYQEKKVLVVKSRRKIEGTQAPSVTIVSAGRDTKTGWKKEGWAGFVETFCKDANTAETIVSCIEQETYNQSEITTKVTLGDMVEGYSNEVKDLNWTEDFTHTYAGRTYTLDFPIKLKALPSLDNTLRIGLELVPVMGLKTSVKYEVYIHDPKYFHVTRNPEPGHPSP